MTVVFILFAVLVIVGAFLALSGKIGTEIAPDDRPGPATLPPAPWSPADVRGLRFRVGLRGYRMSDVDAALAALADQLQAPDGEQPTVPGDQEPVGPADATTDEGSGPEVGDSAGGHVAAVETRGD